MALRGGFVPARKRPSGVRRFKLGGSEILLVTFSVLVAAAIKAFELVV